MDEATRRKIDNLVREKIELTDYDPNWALEFKKESRFLRDQITPGIVERIEHFGSTAISGCIAKPIIDILVEVKDLDLVRRKVVPALKNLGYEYLWRPSMGEMPPFYAWFIKRDRNGVRTHHIHMVEKDSPLWDRLYFRDWLIEHPDEVHRYNKLKISLSGRHQQDREAYTMGKSKYITNITTRARAHYSTDEIG